MKLLEAYAKRIQIAEGVYAQEHEEAMPREKKVVVAALLNNANKYLTESFENSVGTQRADIKNYKKFVLNLTNIAVPNLVAFDLVMVKPLTSRSGYATFIKYVAGSNKGGVAQGDTFHDTFGLGKIDESRVNYTSQAIVEDAKAGEFTPSWTPVEGKISISTDNGATWEEKDLIDGKVTLDTDCKVKYLYDNVIIPQNDLPILNAVTAEVPLVAKPRRIAIYYSQMAAYEMKMELGEDLGKNLANEAVNELKFEIDNEIVMFLDKLAGAVETEVTFSKTLPVGVSKRDHYASFAETIEAANVEVYNKTMRYSPNYLVCARDVIQVLLFCPEFKAASTKNINGPYVAGTFNGMKVIVSPALEAGRFFVGVNEGNVSAAIYAPYMA